MYSVTTLIANPEDPAELKFALGIQVVGIMGACHAGCFNADFNEPEQRQALIELATEQSALMWADEAPQA